MADERLLILVLPSIHDILALEVVMKKEGLWLDLLPKPTSISSDCGMVLTFRSQDWHAVRAILQSGPPTPGKLYRREGVSSYAELDMGAD